MSDYAEIVKRLDAIVARADKDNSWASFPTDHTPWPSRPELRRALRESTRTQWWSVYVANDGRWQWYAQAAEWCAWDCDRCPIALSDSEPEVIP